MKSASTLTKLCRSVSVLALMGASLAYGAGPATAQDAGQQPHWKYYPKTPEAP